MSTFTFPGPTSTYVPNLEASNNLTVQFTRNPSEFAIARYAQYVPVPQMAGKYVTIDSAAARRISDGNMFAWPDGEQAPVGKGYGFTFNDFSCNRYSYPFMLGWLAEQQASWQIDNSHTAISLNLLMTWRTTALRNRVCTLSNWPSTNYSDITSTVGNWNGSTVANSYIRKSFDKARTQIIKGTNGVVQSKDLLVVMDPNTAKIIAESPEYIGTLQQSPFALGLASNDMQFDQYGLPPKLFGFNVVVEDTPLSTNIEGITESTNFLYSSVTDPGTSSSLGNVVMFCSRPGGIMGASPMNPTFSTNSLFFYEELTVELLQDTINRRTLGRCVSNFDTRITAPASGYIGYNCWS